MNAIRTAAFASLLTLTACGQTASEEPAPVIEGAWEVDSAASRLSYVSIKQGEIAETNTFETVTGSVTGAGEAMVEIELASVSTGVDIRNERMRDIFFSVADNPKATVTAKVDPASFEALAVGESADTTIDGTLSLAGVEAPFQAEVSVTRAGPDRVIAVTDKPVIIEAGRFELADELAELQELAGLDSITPVVPVTFSIAFQR